VADYVLCFQRPIFKTAVGLIHRFNGVGFVLEWKTCRKSPGLRFSSVLAISYTLSSFVSAHNIPDPKESNCLLYGGSGGNLILLNFLSCLRWLDLTL
jgi:hypothetical protein